MASHNASARNPIDLFIDFLGVGKKVMTVDAFVFFSLKLFGLP